MSSAVLQPCGLLKDAKRSLYTCFRGCELPLGLHLREHAGALCCDVLCFPSGVQGSRDVHARERCARRAYLQHIVTVPASAHPVYTHSTAGGGAAGLPASFAGHAKPRCSLASGSHS
jgi:hypothetical protein